MWNRIVTALREIVRWFTAPATQPPEAPASNGGYTLWNWGPGDGFSDMFDLDGIPMDDDEW